MRKSLFIIMITLLSSVNCLAEEGSSLAVSELFYNMPDSILPYMPQNLRKDLVSLKNMEPDSTATVETSIGNVKMTRLTNDILTLQLSDNSSLEIGRLDNDNILLINTYCAPLPESKCCIYNNEWSKKRTVNFSIEDLPMPQGEEDKEKISKIISEADFILISATITENPREITLQYNVPFSYKDDNNEAIKHFLQRNVKWNKGTLK